MAWDNELAQYWRNYVPPCRPCRHNLDECSKLLQLTGARAAGRRPRVLILGSTVEFRDWAFEEHVEAVVVDNSESFHLAVSQERRHFNHRESVSILDWREIDFQSEFDLVLGDLVVGNLPRADLRGVLGRVSRALRPTGWFVTKSFFGPNDRARLPLSTVLQRLKHPELATADPFPAIAYDLTISCTDWDTGILHFGDMHAALADAHHAGHLSHEHFLRFQEFGWDGVMKIDFLVPTFEEWEALASEAFIIDDVIHGGPETCHRGLPLYILRPKSLVE